jgi:hypothetical protein
MTVNITKPAINLRSELADLRKPTGIAGEAMLRAETPQEQFNLIGAGRRNLFINGAHHRCPTRNRQSRHPRLNIGLTAKNWRCVRGTLKSVQ